MTSGEETYALVIDLDGTALDDKGLLPDLNREALNRFVGDGGFLIVSTGRTRASAFSALDGVDLAAGCLTCDNGCTIYRGLELAGARLPGVAQQVSLSYLPRLPPPHQPFRHKHHHPCVVSPSAATTSSGATPRPSFGLHPHREPQLMAQGYAKTFRSLSKLRYRKLEA